MCCAITAAAADDEVDDDDEDSGGVGIVETEPPPPLTRVWVSPMASGFGLVVDTEKRHQQKEEKEIADKRQRTGNERRLRDKV